MTTVIEDRRQEPVDEERLCAPALGASVPMHSLNTALLCLRRPFTRRCDSHTINTDAAQRMRGFTTPRPPLGFPRPLPPDRNDTIRPSQTLCAAASAAPAQRSCHCPVRLQQPRRSYVTPDMKTPLQVLPLSPHPHLSGAFPALPHHHRHRAVSSTHVTANTPHKYHR